METQWYVVREHGGEQYGPYPKSQLQSLVDEGRITRTDRVWTEGMSDWAPVTSLPDLGLDWGKSPPVPPPNPYASPNTVSTTEGGQRFDPADRFVAAALAILLPGFGAHKFFYGANGAAITMLLCSLLPCGMGFIITSPISIIEGIIFLVKTPEEFHRIYRVEKKGWF